MKTNTQEISKAEALTLYKESSAAGKKILIEKFGKEAFIEKTIDISKINTVEDIIKLSQPSKELLALVTYKGKDKHMIGAMNMALLFLLTELYNDGWEADWTNIEEKKWYPWFDGREGFAFSCSTYDAWTAGTTVGSRLCFKTEALSDLSVKKFPNIYKSILIK